MTLTELKSIFLNKLTKIYQHEEILSFYYILIKNYLQLEKTEVFLKPNLKISKNNLIPFNKAIKLLEQEIPIQYILGRTEFCGLTFIVNENVLIPRPETEELVEWIISDIKCGKLDSKQKESNNNTENSRQQTTPKTNDQHLTPIIDIGTGSGCIAICLAHFYPNSKVYALDVSSKALEIAKKNAAINNINIHFIKQDILNISKGIPSTTTIKYDIIVSNPPYVRELEKHEIKNNVLQNEPHLALFVNDINPLLFYDKIADFANKNLSKNGKLFLEINQYLASETVSLLKRKGFESIELREDIFGNKRMIKATVKSNL